LHDASLNRVIDAAGISKGSMYYFFDGKEDLYNPLAPSNRCHRAVLSGAVAG